MNFIIDKHFKKDTDEYRKSRIFIWNILAVCVITVIFSILTYNSPIYGSVSYWPILVLAFVLLSILFFTGNLSLCVDITCFLTLIILIKPILVSGGVNSILFMWLMVSPLCALTIGNLKKGMVWAGITVLTQLWIFSMDVTPISVEQFKFSDKSYLLFSHISFAFIIFAMTLSYELMKVKQQKTIQLQLEKLIEQRHSNLQMIQQLQSTEQALNLSNRELKLFAFAAAHDLKELLRMIGTHIQVIQKQLNSHIDRITQEHMSFVMIGVKRMEELLRNLIVHGQVGNNEEVKMKINLNQICDFAIKKANSKINNVSARAHIETLPTIFYYEMEIAQLFQNLVDNALKFRKPNVQPEVFITYSENDTEYLFTIKDNGIGIEPEYQESVFDLFARLHTRYEYEGSGIGLATCKKIVTYLGGQIWLDSIKEEGTTVYFSMLKSHVEYTQMSTDVKNIAA